MSIVDRLRGETAEQQWNKLAKHGSAIAASDALSTKEWQATGALQEVLIAVKKEVASEEDTGGGRVECLPEIEGRIAQICLSCKGGPQTLGVYFWPSEVWTARNEALFEEAAMSTKVTLSVNNCL